MQAVDSSNSSQTPRLVRPIDWSTKEVVAWINLFPKLKGFSHLFESHGVVGVRLVKLGNLDLVELGVDRKAAPILRNHIQKLDSMRELPSPETSPEYFITSLNNQYVTLVESRYFILTSQDSIYR